MNNYFHSWKISLLLIGVMCVWTAVCTCDFYSRFYHTCDFYSRFYHWLEREVCQKERIITSIMIILFLSLLIEHCERLVFDLIFIWLAPMFMLCW
jgi:hypothetical protein